MSTFGLIKFHIALTFCMIKLDRMDWEILYILSFLALLSMMKTLVNSTFFHGKLELIVHFSLITRCKSMKRKSYGSCYLLVDLCLNSLLG